MTSNLPNLDPNSLIPPREPATYSQLLDEAAKVSLREDLANIEAVVSDARMRRMKKSASRMSEAQVSPSGVMCQEWEIRVREK